VSDEAIPARERGPDRPRRRTPARHGRAARAAAGGPGDRAVADGRPAGLDGILLVRKPIGPTSHDVVAVVRRLSGTRRVGHGGTLDPFASGILAIFLGRATRIVEYHMTDRKRYRATVCFGASSTTDDLEGELTPVAGPAPDRAAVEAALDKFRGTITQVPPAYSAVKVAGRRAYALARAGKTPEIAPRTVTIDVLDLVAWDGTDPERPIAIVDVGCSAGTYVRAIARDLGAALGSAAYLGALERTASGPFSVEDAVALDELRDTPRESIARRLLPLDAGLDALPVVELDAEGARAVERGQRVREPRHAPADADRGSAIAAGGAAPAPVHADEPARPDGVATSPGPRPEVTVRLRAPDGSLVAIGRAVDGWIAPVKVLTPARGRGADDRGRD
jgi:tRNA pseudouridine55 synthase